MTENLSLIHVQEEHSDTDERGNDFHILDMNYLHINLIIYTKIYGKFINV